MMASVTNQPPGKPNHTNEQKALLNTHIHNYLVHEGHFDLAKAIRNSSLSLNQQSLKKEGANMGRQINGTDDSMDTDTKDDVNNRIEGTGAAGAGNAGAPANNQPTKLGDTFLLDYWFIFWDMWASSKRSMSERPVESPGSSPDSYWDHQKSKKSQLGTQALLQQGTVPTPFGPFTQRTVVGGNPPQFNNLQKTAMANNGRNMHPANYQNMRMQQQLAAQQGGMPMEGPEVDFNVQPRPPSPMSAGDNAPSPKRPRMEVPYNAGPNMAARNPMAAQLPNGAPGNPDAMRMQNPKNFSPDQLTNMMQNSHTNARNHYSVNMANSAKAAMNANGMPNSMPGAMAQMSPEMPDGSPNGNAEMMMYQNAGGKNVTAGNGGALADYQMQLMLLEQQNKKRLMVARQENQHDPQRFPAQLGAPAMSPHGSKNGHSPPGSDRQRGTPRMGQGGSPLPDGQPNRSSPAPGAFGDMNAMNMGQPFMHPNGTPMLRPPPGAPNAMAAQQFEMFQRNAGRMPSGNWGNPGMPTQMPPGQPQQGNPDANQQRGNMPPPQAPPAANKPSPTQQPAPTPTQTNTKNTKKKGEAKEPKKKQTKKNSQSAAAAAPSTATESAPTPTPQTPSTPMNPESQLIKGTQPATSQSQQQQPQPAQQQQQQGQQVNNTNSNNVGTSQENSVSNPAPFGNLGNMEGEMFPVDYMGDHNDVLDAFDFDTFLESGAMDGAMDGSAFPDFPLPTDGMETGTNDV